MTCDRCCLSFFGIYIISGDRNDADANGYSKTSGEGNCDDEDLLLGEKKNGDIKSALRKILMSYDAILI